MMIKSSSKKFFQRRKIKELFVELSEICPQRALPI